VSTGGRRGEHAAVTDRVSHSLRFETFARGFVGCIHTHAHIPYTSGGSSYSFRCALFAHAQPRRAAHECGRATSQTMPTMSEADSSRALMANLASRLPSLTPLVPTSHGTDAPRLGRGCGSARAARRRRRSRACRIAPWTSPLCSTRSVRRFGTPSLNSQLVVRGGSTRPRS